MGNLTLTVGSTKGSASTGELAMANAIIDVLRKEGNSEYDQLVGAFHSLTEAQRQQLEAIFAGEQLDAYGAGAYAEDHSFFKEIVDDLNEDKKIEFVRFLKELGIQMN